MKKLLGSTLALAMFLPAGANAELLKNLKVGGQLDVQTTSARNVLDFVTRENGNGTAPTNNDRIGHANARLMLSGMWDVLDDVHGKVTIVKGASNHVTRTYGQASDSLQDVQGNTFVEEASVKIDKLFGSLDTTIGRQFYGEPGDLIVYYGPRDNYGQRVDAIDAFRADWSNEHMNVTAIAGKTTDSGIATAPGTASAVDLRGIVISCMKSDMVKPTLSVYNKVTHPGASDGTNTGALGSQTGRNDNLWVADLKAKVNMGGLWAQAEIAKNFGENRSLGTAPDQNYKGQALLAKVGYKLDVPSVAMVQPWGEFGWGSGDNNFNYGGNSNFQSINTDYRPGGIYGRFDNTAALALGGNLGAVGFAGSSNGLTNRTIWGLGVKATPSLVSKLTVGAQYYRYAFTKTAPGAAVGNNNGVPTSRNIGSEVDVTGEWKHSENVSLTATAGSFLPGKYVSDVKGVGAALNPAVMLAGDVHIKF